MVHGLGTGTDTRLGWVQVLDLIRVGVVLAAASWRLVKGWPAGATARISAGFAPVAVMVLVAAWAYAGPLQSGWARRAGTTHGPRGHVALLCQIRLTSPPAALAPASTQASGVPALPFMASLSGRLTQAGLDSAAVVTKSIDTRVSGPMSGSVLIVLRGQAAASGVSLESSSVSFGPARAPSEYRGAVVLLSGDQIVTAVRSESGPRVQLAVVLQIDPGTGSVQGNMDAQAGPS